MLLLAADRQRQCLAEPEKKERGMERWRQKCGEVWREQQLRKKRRKATTSKPDPGSELLRLDWSSYNAPTCQY